MDGVVRDSSITITPKHEIYPTRTAPVLMGEAVVDPSQIAAVVG